MALRGTAVRPYLLVGECPNRATASRPSLWLMPDASGVAHTGNRLLEISGLDSRAYRRLFDATNAWLEPQWPGDATARAGLVERADELAGRRVIALGRRAAAALGAASQYDEAWWWIWCGVSLGGADFELATMPHPSGRCRHWNDWYVRLAARKFFGGLRA